MRPQVSVLKQQIHNWIAVVAVLAVTLLGAVAINRTSSERDQATRSAIVTVCEQINTGRLQIGVEFGRLSAITESLDGALRVAQQENGQSTTDRIEYARLQAILTTVQAPHDLPMIDCAKMFTND